MDTIDPVSKRHCTLTPPPHHPGTLRQLTSLVLLESELSPPEPWLSDSEGVSFLTAAAGILSSVWNETVVGVQPHTLSQWLEMWPGCWQRLHTTWLRCTGGRLGGFCKRESCSPIWFNCSCCRFNSSFISAIWINNMFHKLVSQKYGRVRHCIWGTSQHLIHKSKQSMRILLYYSPSICLRENNFSCNAT